MALLAAPQQHPALLTKACKLQRPDKQTVQGLITLTAFYLTWDSTDKAGADDVKLLIASITSKD